MGEALVEHRMRLENGTKAFERMDTSIRDIDKRTTPKPPSVVKIVSVTFGCFVVVASALWGLSVMLSDRPTTSQVKDVMLDHDRHGHEEVRAKLNSMDSSIAAQEVLIKDVKAQQSEIRDAQKDIDKKIDAVIRRANRNR